MRHPVHKKAPLYRKVNTRARGVHHDHGPDYRSQRGEEQRMAHGRRRGLDYTPLFRFLLSRARAGAAWDEVYSEAISRLDREEPLYWLVARPGEAPKSVVCIGESSHYSGLYVDEGGILRVVSPELGPESLQPTCACCTHTLNGVPFTQKYRP